MITRLLKTAFSGISLVAGLIVTNSCYGMDIKKEVLEPKFQADMYYRDAYSFLDGQHPDKRIIAQNLFETALILNHPYAASALCKNIHKDNSLKEKVLLKSIYYKSKHHIRDGFLQDVDMLLYVVKINQTKEIFNINDCYSLKYFETDKIKEIEYLESINPQLAIERYGCLGCNFDAEKDNEISDSALQALIRLSQEWPSCYLHMSLAYFMRGIDGEALSYLEKAIKSGTVDQEQWLEKCIYHDNKGRSYNKNGRPFETKSSIKEQCWKILINKRDNNQLPLEFRRKTAALVLLNHNFFNGEFYDQEKYAQINGTYSIKQGDFNIAENMFQDYVTYISILKESKNKNIECHISEIENVFKHIIFIDSIDIDKRYRYNANSCNFRKSSLLRYAGYYKRLLSRSYNIDINNPIWESISENYLDTYSGATEFYKILEIETDDNLAINLCYHLYKRSEKLLLENVNDFVLYLCITDDSKSLSDLYEVTRNPFFKCIISFLQKPKYPFRRGGQSDILNNDIMLKTDFDYAPQYDVVLYNYDDILNVELERDKNSYLNLQRRKIVEDIFAKKDKLVNSLSAEQQFNLALDYELIHSCLSSIQRPCNLIQDSYLNCLWLSVCNGSLPARQKLAHLYTKGDKKEFVEMYMLLQQFQIPQDICNFIMFKYIFIDSKK